MSRRLRYPLVAVAWVMSPLIAASAGAQLAGIASRAADFAPVDASALGVTRQSSIGLSVNNSDLVLGGGIGTWGGAMHVYLGAGANNWSSGIAYSRTAFVRPLVPGLRFTLGEQLSGGYRRFGPEYQGAVNLKVPVGLTLGNPDGASLAAYAAPYGELGVEHFRNQRCDFVSCTGTGVEYRGMNAAGIGLGLRASAGRFTIGMSVADLAYRKRFYLPKPSSLQTLGVSVQLGK
ncbi:MAG: hypothetical protein ACJ796_21895 [Gemmatimonadaceae bacterium]